MPRDTFEDLRRRFDALERNLGGMDSMFENLQSQLGTLPVLPPQSRGTTQSFQGYTLQIGPDGVTLESTENADGNGEKRTYKAKNMDELLQNYPELREKLGGSEHFDLQGAPGQNWFFLRDGLPDNDWLRSPRPSQQPPTDVLGIYSQKLTPEQAKELELEPEQGLRIESIKPGTIAQILGLRRGDTVVELNGQPIYSADDVRRILKERKADADLTVTLLGEGSKTRRTLRWSPAEPQPAGAATPAPARRRSRPARQRSPHPRRASSETRRARARSGAAQCRPAALGPRSTQCAPEASRARRVHSLCSW